MILHGDYYLNELGASPPADVTLDCASKALTSSCMSITTGERDLVSMFDVFPLETDARSGPSFRSTSDSPKAGAARKTRASCDACSLSKVRCDKQRPACQRCVVLGLACYYSPSLRMGKRPGKRFNARNPPVQPPLVDWNFSAIIPPATAEWRPSESEATMSMPLSDTIQLGRRDSGPRIEPRRSFSIATSDQAPSCLVEFQPEEMASMTNRSGMLEQWHATQMTHNDSPDLVLGFDDGLQSSLENLQHITAAFDVDVPPINSDLAIDPGSVRSSDRHYDCTSLVLASLQRLYFLSTSSCVPKPVSTSPTIDQVLTINKTAIQHVYRLLACSCSRDPSVPLLVAAICAKVFAWYQAIARVNSVNSGSSTTVAVTAISSYAETVIHTPVTLGAYQLDGADEERMRTQLMLSEVQKAERLVDKFAERFGWDAEAGPDQAGKADHDPGVCLRTRLQEIASETMNQFQ